MSTVNRRQFLQYVGAGATHASISTFPALAVSVRGQENPAADVYWPTPRSAFERRRCQYPEYCSANARQGRNGLFSQIARLELGKDQVDKTVFRHALDFAYANNDCSDFIVAGLLRILYLYRESPLISRQLIADIEQCVLHFKYWWDGPGRDKRCYHTDNHQIIYHGDELLAG